jgi:hypothetical protein
MEEVELLQEGEATYWAVRRQTAKHFGPQAGDLRTICREVVLKGCGGGWFSAPLFSLRNRFRRLHINVVRPCEAVTRPSKSFVRRVGWAVAVGFEEIRWGKQKLSADRLAGAAGVRCPFCQAAGWQGGTSLRHVVGVWQERQPLVLEGLDGRQSLVCQQAPRWCIRLCK